VLRGDPRGRDLSNDGRGKGLLAPDASRARSGRSRPPGATRGSRPLAPCRSSSATPPGTPVGDKTEVDTLTRFFGDRVHRRADRLAQVQPRPPDHRRRGRGSDQGAGGDAPPPSDPPTLHVDEPVDLSATPFRLLAKAEPWPSDGPRLATVSAFGFGGNNAHVVVEEFHGPIPLPAAQGRYATAGARPRARRAVVGGGRARAPGRRHRRVRRPRRLRPERGPRRRGRRRPGDAAARPAQVPPEGPATVPGPADAAAVGRDGGRRARRRRRLRAHGRVRGLAVGPRGLPLRRPLAARPLVRRPGARGRGRAPGRRRPRARVAGRRGQHAQHPRQPAVVAARSRRPRLHHRRRRAVGDHRAAARAPRVAPRGPRHPRSSPPPTCRPSPCTPPPPARSGCRACPATPPSCWC
jgi:hypothetical protein